MLFRQNNKYKVIKKKKIQHLILILEMEYYYFIPQIKYPPYTLESVHRLAKLRNAVKKYAVEYHCLAENIKFTGEKKTKISP